MQSKRRYHNLDGEIMINGKMVLRRDSGHSHLAKLLLVVSTFHGDGNYAAAYLDVSSSAGNGEGPQECRRKGIRKIDNINYSSFAHLV